MHAKQPLESKTILFNLCVAVLAAIAENVGLLQSFMSERGFLILMLGTSIVNVFLRCKTCSAISFGDTDDS